MTRDELIKILQENIRHDAEMDFLYVSRTGQPRFMDFHNACMNADADDPDNYNRGGIVFIEREEDKEVVGDVF